MRPLLEYCTPVWSPHNIGNINKVEGGQRRFMKSMNGLSSLSYISRLYELSLEMLESRCLKQDLLMCFNTINSDVEETLESQRLKQDLLMCFKIINGDIEIDLTSFFAFSTNCVTRGHRYKLLKQSMRVDAYKFSFANRVFTAWNNLPASVVDCCKCKYV